MQEKLAIKLIGVCPQLYQNCKPHAFKCGDGWFDILQAASTQIENMLESKQGIWAVAIFEKYGSLRLELNQHDDELETIVLNLESLSEKTCELCGAAGTLSTTSAGWDAVRCNCCRN